jgi:hypothetical protein
MTEVVGARVSLLELIELAVMLPGPRDPDTRV